MMRSHASRVVARGFSQNTCLPAARQASTYSSCVGPHEVTTTASTPGSSMSAWPLSCTVTPSSATERARSRSTSVTAATRTPERTWVSLRMWS